MLHEHVRHEIELADRCLAAGDIRGAKHHLKRAHILGQAMTGEHTRVHWRMLMLAMRTRSLREIWGQLIRIAGAATKTPFGIYPTGNTGGADVWFFKPMPIPVDLQDILDKAKIDEGKLSR